MKAKTLDPLEVERARTKVVLNMAKAWRDAARALAYRVVMDDGDTGAAEDLAGHLAEALLERAKQTQRSKA